MKGRIISYSPYESRLTLKLDDDFREQYDELHDKDLDIAIKRWRNKRSLNANAYCWALINEIANVLRTDKQSVYIELLKRYGQGGLVYIPDGCEHVLRELKYSEFDEQVEGGAYYRVWVGSSQYNSREMSVLIDGVISEAKELGIPTEPQREINRMLSEWDTKKA